MTILRMKLILLSGAKSDKHIGSIGVHRPNQKEGTNEITKIIEEFVPN